MPRKDVTGEEWTEVVGESLEDDYSIIVRDNDVYLAAGSKPTRPVAGLPIQAGAIQSGEIDRGDAIYARSQTDATAQVRAVPGLRIDGSNERAVSVTTTVSSNTYGRGDSFDAAVPIGPIDPSGDVRAINATIVSGEVGLKIKTTDGDIFTVAVDAPVAIDDYDVDEFEFTDPNNNGARVAGSWAGVPP